MGNGRRKRCKTEVVENHHALLRWFFSEINYQKEGGPKRAKNGERGILSESGLASAAGLGVNTLRQWKLGTTPTLGLFDAACNVLGYRVTVIRIDDPNGEDHP